MILIQSSETDNSTDDVLDWIRFLFPKAKSERINDENRVVKMVQRISNSSNDLSIQTSGSKNIELKTLKSWWYRRGYFDFHHVQHSLKNKENSKISFAFQEFLTKEYQSLEGAIDHTLTDLTRSVNSFQDNNTNKISNLAIAARLDIRIPDTIITNDPKELRAFYDQYSRIITKGIFRTFLRIDYGKDYSIGFSCDTTLVSEDDISRIESQALGNLGLPALFQQYIDKAYELRIFYFEGKLYPMAIFSQSNTKTQVDVRIYDRERPNRCVPYQLPAEIEDKLRSLMAEIKLRSGSIDMIVTPDREYVFLEVNPIGKYQWLRENCNYDIDETIARYLAAKINSHE